MRSSHLVAALAVLGGAAAGAGALTWLKRRRSVEKEPPSATFEEWIASVVAYQEAAQVGGNSCGVPADAQPRMSPTSVPTLRRLAKGGERLKFFS